MKPKNEPRRMRPLTEERNERRAQKRAIRKERRKRNERRDNIYKEELNERRQRDSVVTLEDGLRAHKMCGSKRRYITQELANFQAFAHTTPLTPLRSYKCPYCSGWHITHVPVQQKVDLNNALQYVI